MLYLIIEIFCDYFIAIRIKEIALLGCSELMERKVYYAVVF